MRIVLDTNALINAQDDDYNYSNRILDRIEAGEIQAFANRGTIRENRLIADRKIQDQAFRDKLERFFDLVQEVDGQPLDAVEDPEDNKILASALAGGAEYLVTSDWHLLKLGEYDGVKIVTPQGFWAEYEQETGEGWSSWVSSFLK